MRELYGSRRDLVAVRQRARPSKKEEKFGANLSPVLEGRALPWYQRVMVDKRDPRRRMFFAKVLREANLKRTHPMMVLATYLTGSGSSALHAIGIMRRILPELEARVVAHVLTEGVTWDWIAAYLCVTKPAAYRRHQRWKHTLADPPPFESRKSAPVAKGQLSLLDRVSPLGEIDI
jgi:hypothetical protein